MTLEPVGKDWDGTYKPIDELSYMRERPITSAELAKAYKFRVFRIDWIPETEAIEPDTPHIVE